MRVISLDDSVRDTVRRGAMDFGGKTLGLVLLHDAGLATPPSLLASSEPGSGDINRATLAEVLESWKTLHFWSGNLLLRSSVRGEDSRSSSRAGFFDSRTVGAKSQNLLLRLSRFVRRLAEQAESAGLGSDAAIALVQPKIDAQIGGVLFSRDPVSSLNASQAVSLAHGPAARVLSHGRAGVGPLDPRLLERLIDVRDSPRRVPLAEVGSHLEAAVGFPVDVEFIGTKEGDTLFVQLRPIANLTRWRTKLLRIAPGVEFFDLSTNPKIELRVRCTAVGVQTNPQWLATETGAERLRADFPAGKLFSAVSARTEGIRGTVRAFAASSRTATRRVLRKQRTKWLRQALLTEIPTTLVSGIANLCKDRLLVEFAPGHFVSKGLVPTRLVSLYKGRVISEKARKRSVPMIVDPRMPPMAVAGPKPRLGRRHLLEIRRSLLKIEAKPTEYFEFGIDDTGGVFFFDWHSAPPLAKAVGIGHLQVVSEGEAAGLLVAFSGRLGGRSTHLNDGLRGLARGIPVIVLARRPALGLLRYFELLASENRRLAGVLFEEFSPLAHLSLLLREAGIPALAGRKISALRRRSGQEFHITSGGSHGKPEIRQLASKS